MATSNTTSATRRQATLEKTINALRATHNHPFRDDSCHPLYNAQRNLQGRTHYVDDDTLEYFKARINYAHTYADGLLFIIIESVAHPSYGRVHRFVAFDVFGTIVNERPQEEKEFSRSTDAAKKKMYQWLDTFDALEHTRQTMRAMADRLSRDAQTLKAGAR